MKLGESGDYGLETNLKSLLGDGNQSSRYSLIDSTEENKKEIYIKNNYSSENVYDVVTMQEGHWDKHFIIDKDNPENIKIKMYYGGVEDTPTKEEIEELNTYINNAGVLLTEKKEGEYERSVEYPGLELEEGQKSYGNKIVKIIDGKKLGII